MKQSQMLTKNGTIYHPITAALEEAKTLEGEILVICANEEIFDEAMVTIMNRYKQAVGLVTIPHSGCKMPKRYTHVSAYIDVLGKTIKAHVMTEAEYQTNKVAVDGGTYVKKHTLTWCGGNN